jgi:hypothetical protein
MSGSSWRSGGVPTAACSLLYGAGRSVETGLQKPDQLLWLERLNAEHDNLRGALAWSTVSDETPDVGMRLAAALWRLWSIRRFFREGRQRCYELEYDYHVATALEALGLVRRRKTKHRMQKSCSP